MPSKQLLGLILLVVGAILLYFGWQSTQSVGDQLTEAMTGRFTDEAMWFLMGGAIALVVAAYYSFGRK